MVEESDAAREGDDGAEVRTDDHGDTGTSPSLSFSAVTGGNVGSNSSLASHDHTPRSS